MAKLALNVRLFAASLVLLILPTAPSVAQQIIPGAAPPVQSAPNIIQGVPIQGIPGQVVPSVQSRSEPVRANSSESFAKARESSGGTHVAVQETLTSLLKFGGIPKSVKELRNLESLNERIIVEKS